MTARLFTNQTRSACAAALALAAAAALTIACGGSTSKDPSPDASTAAPSATSSSSPPPDGPACSTAKDCTGTLPHQCRPGCTTGTGCAHWTCPAGSCVVSYCD